MACYVQIDFPCFVRANICAPLLSVLYSYLQLGMTVPPGCFRWLCMLEQIPCLLSVVSLLLLSSFFCLYVSFLSLPLLRYLEMLISLSASVPQKPKTECRFLKGDATLLISSQVSHNIAPCGTVSV